MARKKLIRFRELRDMPNVVDRSEAVPRGEWVDEYLPGKEPLILELGCGRGEYSLGLARLDSENRVIGIDRNGARIWKGATRALEEGLENLVFLRTDIEYLGDHFSPGQVSTIWIPFPDPLPKRRQAKHRLVGPRLLDTYRPLLADSGAVHVKTDDPELFEYALESSRRAGARIETVCRELAEGGDEPQAAIVTTYERRYRDEDRAIHYCRFSF